jgi:outer membrane protein with beta-barrel domain
MFLTVNNLRKYLIILFMSLSIGNCISQDIGFYASLNNTNLKGDKPSGFRFEPGTGFEIGAFFDIKVAEDVLLSFQPGIYRSSSVIRVRDRDNIERKFKDSLDLRLDYLSLPLMVKIYFENSKKLYFTTGIQFGILLQTRLSNKSNETNSNKIFESLNLAVNFGLGYKFPIKSNYVFLEMKYAQGILNITDFNNPDELFTRVKLQGIQWTAGFGIPLKKKQNE